MPRTPSPGSPGWRSLVAVLGALSAFGPLATDLYLPGLPSVAGDLQTTEQLAQATMSATLFGLGIGQLIIGPVSDRIGRRRPLIAGMIAFTIASALCALAPSVELLLALRLIQGIAGASGIVIARSVVRDLVRGKDAARVFSMIALVLGLAPILAPLIGAGMLMVTSWRGLFVALAIIGLALVAATVLVVPETLIDERASHGGVVSVLRDFGVVLAKPPFALFALALAANAGILFSYITMSPAIYQQGFGLSAQAFGVLFAVNGIGMMAASRTNAWLVSRVDLATLLTASISAAAMGSAIVLVAGLLNAPLWVVALGVLIASASHGISMPNLNALAMEPFATRAGSAAAVLGGAQFVAAGLIPALASLGGSSVLTMGVTMTVSGVVALWLVLAARGTSRNRS